MTRHDPIVERVLAIVEPACISSGYELVDVRFTMDQGGWVLRVYIERPPAPGEVLDVSQVPSERVDLNDCERISRELSALLDVEDPITQAYSLEVSSPGIDRPLRTAVHFQRYLGADVKIVMAVPLVVEGAADRRNFRGKLVAVEGDDEVDAIAVVEIDGQKFRLRLRDVEQAKLVPDWDAVLKGGSGLGASPAAPKTGRSSSKKAGGHPKAGRGKPARS